MFEAKAKASDSAADKSTSELSCAGTVLRDYSAQGTYQEAAQTPKPSKGQLHPGDSAAPKIASRPQSEINSTRDLALGKV